MEISQDLWHRPIVFIRFNPDEYYIGERKIQSCWSYDKKGICRLTKKHIDKWNERLNILKQQIEYWTNATNKTNKTLEIIQMNYTNFKKQCFLKLRSSSLLATTLSSLIQLYFNDFEIDSKNILVNDTLII